MKKMKITVVFLCMGFFTAANAVQEVTLKNGKDEVIGVAVLTAVVKGVKIGLDVHGLQPGAHAIHFHEKSVCKGPKFESAGGHFAPMKTKHGFDMEGGPHAGDMANFMVGSDGAAKVELINTMVSLGAGTESLVKAGGTALVIHEKADDYKSQPAGDAGARVACGEIKAN